MDVSDSSRIRRNSLDDGDQKPSTFSTRNKKASYGAISVLSTTSSQSGDESEPNNDELSSNINTADTPSFGVIPAVSATASQSGEESQHNNNEGINRNNTNADIPSFGVIPAVSTTVSHPDDTEGIVSNNTNQTRGNIMATNTNTNTGTTTMLGSSSPSSAPTVLPTSTSSSAASMTTITNTTAVADVSIAASSSSSSTTTTSSATTNTAADHECILVIQAYEDTCGFSSSFPTSNNNNIDRCQACLEREASAACDNAEIHPSEDIFASNVDSPPSSPTPLLPQQSDNFVNFSTMNWCRITDPCPDCAKCTTLAHALYQCRRSLKCITSSTDINRNCLERPSSSPLSIESAEATVTTTPTTAPTVTPEKKTATTTSKPAELTVEEDLPIAGDTDTAIMPTSTLAPSLSPPASLSSPITNGTSSNTTVNEIDYSIGFHNTTIITHNSNDRMTAGIFVGTACAAWCLVGYLLLKRRRQLRQRKGQQQQLLVTSLDEDMPLPISCMRNNNNMYHQDHRHQASVLDASNPDEGEANGPLATLSSAVTVSPANPQEFEGLFRLGNNNNDDDSEEELLGSIYLDDEEDENDMMFDDTIIPTREGDKPDLLMMDFSASSSTTDLGCYFEDLERPGSDTTNGLFSLAESRARPTSALAARSTQFQENRKDGVHQPEPDHFGLV